jgi:hypothetical protein
VLTDKDGFTLYRFAKDTAKPPKSSWRRDCAKAWRPVLSQGSIDVQGVAAGVVGKVTRTDGSGNVTVGGGRSTASPKHPAGRGQGPRRRRHLVRHRAERLRVRRHPWRRPPGPGRRLQLQIPSDSTLTKGPAGAAHVERDSPVARLRRI